VHHKYNMISGHLETFNTDFGFLTLGKRNKKRVSKAMKLPTGSTRSASRSLPDVEVEDTGSELSVCNRRHASVHRGVNVVVRTCIIR